MIVQWHLIGATGTVVRSCEASCKEEARFRLAPVPTGWSVLSALEWAIPVRPALTDEEARGLATKAVRPAGDPAKAARQARWKDKRKARGITGQQRQAIAQSATRRMLERMRQRQQQQGTQ